MKSKTTAYVLWFFFGLWGGHRFYLGRPGMGILYLFTLGLFGVGWIYDLFTLSKQVDKYNAGYGVPQKEETIIHAAYTNNEEVIKTGRYDYTILDELFDEFSGTSDELRIKDVPLRIEYGGGRDGHSIRDIDIKSVSRSRDFDNPTTMSFEYFVTAYCHYRNANRTFTVSRIISAESSGEKTDIVLFLFGICKAGDGYNRVLAIKYIREFLKEYTPERKEISILTYIARIDGTFSKKERAIITNYAIENNYLPGIAPEYWVEELNNFEPSTRLFKQFVKRLEATEKFYNVAKEIAGKDSIRLGAFNLVKKPGGDFEKP
jgi:hypothetical protein